VLAWHLVAIQEPTTLAYDASILLQRRSLSFIALHLHLAPLALLLHAALQRSSFQFCLRSQCLPDRLVRYRTHVDSSTIEGCKGLFAPRHPVRGFLSVRPIPPFLTYSPSILPIPSSPLRNFSRSFRSHIAVGPVSFKLSTPHPWTRRDIIGEATLRMWLYFKVRILSVCYTHRRPHSYTRTPLVDAFICSFTDQYAQNAEFSSSPSSSATRGSQGRPCRPIRGGLVALALWAFGTPPLRLTADL
jgi:hypothetical protein